MIVNALFLPTMSWKSSTEPAAHRSGNPLQRYEDYQKGENFLGKIFKVTLIFPLFLGKFIKKSSIFAAKLRVCMIQNNNNEAEKVHFAVMAIGAAADLMGISPSEMHKRLDKVGLVKNLLFDLYDVEHTQSLQNVAEDVVDALHNWEKQISRNL